jgi:hypothetical protein
MIISMVPITFPPFLFLNSFKSAPLAGDELRAAHPLAFSSFRMPDFKVGFNSAVGGKCDQEPMANITVQCTFMQAFARVDDQGVKRGIKPILLNGREKGFQIDFFCS